MTNEMIILQNRIELMKKGKISTTGKQFTFKNSADGKEITIDEPEQIHTYAAWKEMGMQVKKGSKAVAKFPIWKYVSKENEETGKTESNMFMKVSSFFIRSQTEEINN